MHVVFDNSLRFWSEYKAGVSSDFFHTSVAFS
jgi:hypothetical protein